jgi:hypothetical protein
MNQTYGKTVRCIADVTDMIDEKQRRSYLIDKDKLPDNFPTQKHAAEFWEQLGRAVATFGFLEDILARATFALTSTRRFSSNEECEAAFANWRKELEGVLSGNLTHRIDNYERAAKSYPGLTIENLNELFTSLRRVIEIRNVLNHACWDQFPDEDGITVPRSFNRHKGRFTTPVGIKFLIDVRKFTAEVACEVINTITYMGWQFPGTDGPGVPVWRRD